MVVIKKKYDKIKSLTGNLGSNLVMLIQLNRRS